MLLRQIYIMALEHPGPGFMGVFEEERLASLKDFVVGYGMCQEDYALNSFEEDWGNFKNYLELKGYYRPKGWVGEIIEECGDGEAAFSKLKELLFEYVELHKPKWFIEYNQKIQPSAWSNVNGPRSTDIRINKHIVISQNSESNLELE